MPWRWAQKLKSDPLGGPVRGVATRVLSFLTGASGAAVLVFAACSGRNSTATVVLSNETSSPLTDVRLHNRETGQTLVVDRIAAGRSETLQIQVRGEGSYVVSANLPSAGPVEAERYVETGYTITEHIGPDQIKPEHALY